MVCGRLRRPQTTFLSLIEITHLLSPPKEQATMALISLQEVSVGFGGPLLLEEVNLQIERGEWVGLLGRNGVGKTTLLKLVNGDLRPQSGVVARQQNLRVATLPQEIPQGLAGSVAGIVAGGLFASGLQEARQRRDPARRSTPGRANYRWSRCSRA